MFPQLSRQLFLKLYQTADPFTEALVLLLLEGEYSASFASDSCGSQFADSPALRVRFDTSEVVPTFHGEGDLEILLSFTLILLQVL